jgi:hypothetical protein
MPRTDDLAALPVAGSGRRLTPLSARRRRRHRADVRPVGGQHRPHAVRARWRHVRQAAERLGPESRARLRVRGRRRAGADRRRARVQAPAGGHRLLPVRLPLHRPASARERPRPPSQRVARRPGRDPLGRRPGRQHRRRAGPRRRGGEPRGRADERRVPARGPAAARPHGRGARPARTARRTCVAAPGGRLRALRLRRLALPRAARRRHVRGGHGARLAVGRRARDHGARELAAAREAG